MAKYRHVYESLNDFADAAMSVSRSDQATVNKHFDSNEIGTVASCADMARMGWDDGMAQATPIIREALTMVEEENLDMTFKADYMVAGSEVMVDRFLQGVPECMVEYELSPISKVGKVITMVASASVSAAISTDSFIRRGAAIAGLALALQDCGHSTELWMDITTTGHDRASSTVTTRILVKGPHDVVDPSRIVFAFTHPGLLRRLWFAEAYTFPEKAKTAISVGTSYGSVTEVTHDLPDGTIYLPALRSNRDVSDPVEFIRDRLVELGLIQE